MDVFLNFIYASHGVHHYFKSHAGVATDSDGGVLIHVILAKAKHEQFYMLGSSWSDRLHA